MKNQILAVVVLITLALAFIFYDEIRPVVIVTAYIIAGLGVLGFLAFVLLYGWYLAEKVKTFRASRIKAEREAHVFTVQVGNQVHIRDTDPHAHWRAAHLDSRLYANGKQTDPTDTERAVWQHFNSPKRVNGTAQVLLPETVTQVDLLAALDGVQRCLIVGASDSGKTTLLQWLVSRRLNTSQVIIIDPHAYPTKWPNGCDVIGTGRDYARIESALTALVQLMTKRYDEIGKGLVAEMAHPRVTILIDEWRAIVYGLGKPASEAIKTLLVESRKAAFSVFVASHSDRAKPLGLAGEYDLKDGFAVVRLAYVNGQRQATVDHGAGEVPATLPGPFAGTPQVVAGQSQVVYPDDFINLEVEPTPTEAHILNLHDQGESYNEISRQVYGNVGGKQTGQIKQVLEKFS